MLESILLTQTGHFSLQIRQESKNYNISILFEVIFLHKNNFVKNLSIDIRHQQFPSL